MKADRALERLRAYETELKEIHSRFTQSSSGIHIRRGDDARLKQLVIEARDLFDDSLGQNNYSSMVVNAFNEGTRNWLNSPSLVCVEQVSAVVSAAITRIHENPEIVEKSKTNNVSEPVAKQELLHAPEKVTLQWLYKHVPYSFWLWLAGLLGAAFVLGIAAAKIPLVQQLFGRHQ